MSFPVVYACLSRVCVVAELHRRGQHEVFGVEGLLPRRLYTYRIEFDHVLDLTDASAQARLGITADALIADDPSVPREIGVIAHGLGLRAIRAPSATGVGEVIAVFLDSIGSSVLEASESEDWNSLQDVRD